VVIGLVGLVCMDGWGFSLRKARSCFQTCIASRGVSIQYGLHDDDSGVQLYETKTADEGMPSSYVTRDNCLFLCAILVWMDVKHYRQPQELVPWLVRAVLMLAEESCLRASGRGTQTRFSFFSAGGCWCWNVTSPPQPATTDNQVLSFLVFWPSGFW
jgi:hypothetical protein